MNFHASLSIFIAGQLMLASCATVMEKVSPELKAKIDSNRQCYFEKAKAVGGAALGCSKDQVQVEIIVVEKVYQTVAPYFTVSDFPQIQSLKVEGCKKTTAVHIFCEFNQGYFDETSCPCRVVDGAGVSELSRVKSEKRKAADSAAAYHARQREAAEQQQRNQMSQPGGIANPTYGRGIP